MDQPQKKSPWPRRLRRAALAVAALAAFLAAWALFFPVPLGGAARFATGRALPADGPLQLGVGDVTFRWRWGQPALALEVRRLRASAQGRPLLDVAAISIELRKAELWQRHVVPTLIAISEPQLTLDQTPAGALALLAPPAAPSSATPPPTPASSGPPNLSPLAALLLPPGEASKLTITSFSVRLKNAAGETPLSFGPIETSLAQTTDGSVQIDLALPLTGGTKPPALSLHATLETRSGRAAFSVKLPAFSTGDLPVIPGAPPLPLRATVAADATGHFDLTTRQLADVAGGFTVSDGDVSLPGATAVVLPIKKIEVRGRYDLSAQHAVLETARAQIGSLDVDLQEFDATLGPEPHARWKIAITGPKGADVLPLLPADLRATLPLSPEAIATVAVDRITSEGSVHLAQNPAGAWSSRSLDAKGNINLALGRESLAVAWTAVQPENAATIATEITSSEFNPAAWPAVLTAGTPAAAIDLPLTFSAQASLSPDFQPRSARVALTAAPGQLKPLQPGLPPLAVRRFEVRLESEAFDRAWRVPVARLELDNGANAELVRAQLELTPGAASAEGELRADNFSGAFAALFLPADTWTPLTAAGLAAKDLSLASLRFRFAGKAASSATAAWQPSSLSATGEVQFRANAVPLTLSTKITLPEGGKEIEATADLAEFRPSQLRLTLPGGLTTAAFDFPVSFHATARASLSGALTSAATQLRLGPGRLKTPAAFGDFDLPVENFTLDATFDPTAQRAEIKNARLSAGGLRLNFSDLAATVAPPHVLTGRAELEAFSLATALALWPASQQPAARQQVQSTIRTADFLGAQFDWNVTFDPAASTPLKISRLRGNARLNHLDALPAGLPGAITVADVNVGLDYPRATVELQNVSAPGAHLSSLRAEISALDTASPSAAVTSTFDVDFPAANRAWHFGPPGLLTGTARGELSLNAPFTAETIAGALTLDLTQATFPLPGFPNAAPNDLKLTFRADHLLAPNVPAALDLSIAAANWLGAPLRLTTRTELTATDRQPASVELKTYEHGVTRLQGRFVQRDALRQEISLTGSTLDLTPLMRFGLAAADAFAATPPPATSAAPLATPAAAPLATPGPPALVSVDVRIDHLLFGPGQTAQQLELHTRLENNWPATLTLQAVAGADNRLSAELSGPADRQKLKLTIGAAADWMRTLTAPWSAAPPPPGQFGSLVVQLMKVPSIVAGGGITAEAELRRRETDWLQGSFKLTRATMVRPPRVLQLLALKTGKTLQQSPLIEEFSIGQVSLSQSELRVSTIALAGSGLIDRLKIKSASYGLADDRLYIDGEYFAVGFEIKNTLAKPEFWGKDSNLLIRSVGTHKDNFGFDDEPEPTPAPKPPTTKR